MANWLDFRAIKRGVSLKSVLQHYGVELRRISPVQYRGCCPIHRGEGRDAFQVNLARKSSLSCSAFVQALDVHVDFPSSSVWLSHFLGKHQIPGLKIHDTRMLRVMEVLLHRGTHSADGSADKSIKPSSPPSNSPPKTIR